RAEDEPGLGQPGLRAGRRARCNTPLRVVDLIGIRQIHDLFRVIPKMLLGYDDTIGNDVVDELGAHRSGVTEVAHLNRRRTAHKYFWTGIVGESFQVHGDVDFQVSKEPRYFAIALMANVDKSVKGAPQTRSHFAAIVGTERNGDRFEPAS